MDKGTLHILAETDAIPSVTYTADESIDRIRDSSAGLTEQKEPAAATLLSRFKPVLNGVITILILVIIFLIILKWQKQRKQDP